MALFHFHLCEGGRPIEIVEDGELPDIESARSRAVAIARRRISDDVLGGNLCLASMILVTDAERQTVVRLLFRNAVTIRGL